MKTLLVCVLLLLPFAVFAADDDTMIVLSMEIHSDGELISEPRVAVAPGTDATVMQGIAAEGFDEELVLNVVFHAIHAQEKGAEVLIDSDFGLGEPKHLGADHVVMNWNEPHEFSFRVAADAPTINIKVTPSRATRSDFLLGRKSKGNN